jgi:hypothetical protein
MSSLTAEYDTSVGHLLWPPYSTLRRHLSRGRQAWWTGELIAVLHWRPQSTDARPQYLIPWARIGTPRADTQDPQLGKELWTWLEEQVAV